MNEFDLLNTPVEFTLGKHTLRFRRISSAQKLSIAYADYLSNLVKDIRQKAKAFEDAEERKQYLRESLAALPSGAALQKIVDENVISSYLLYKWLEAANADGIPADQIQLIFEDAERDEGTAVLAFLRYGKKNYSSPLMTGEKSQDTLQKNMDTLPTKSDG